MKKNSIKLLSFILALVMIQIIIFPVTSLAAPRWNSSNWMSQQYDNGHIRNTPLNRLALPGSHDALTYNLDKGTWDQTNNGFLRGNGIVQNVIYNYAKTQHANLADQLSEGIRYFDIRLKKDRDGHIRGYHGMFGSRVHNYLFKEVSDFLNNNPNEIIILDFQSLHNLSDGDVQYLDYQLDQFLRGRLADRNVFNPSSTIEAFRNSAARVIILTDNQWWINKSMNVWRRSSNVVSNWKNTSNINTLMNHLDADLANKNSQKFYVSQMVLSPNSDEILNSIKDAAKKLPIPFYGPVNFGIVLGKLASNSLYKMSTSNNGRLESWISSKSKGSLNITMRDFYTQTHVINTINLNK